MHTHRHAFTLIELLIVVAIIAILAAIAVPNFLEAQTRAKVSRMKSDMRSTATAIESYRIDWNRYPFASEHDNLSEPLPSGSEPFEGHLPAVITTPVAYMTSLVPDVFFNRDSGFAMDIPIHYGQRLQATDLGEPDFFGDLTLALLGRDVTATEWYMFSHGPDQDHDESLDGSEPDLDTQLYDPTNGTISNGDIYDLGPGIGLLN